MAQKEHNSLNQNLISKKHKTLKHLFYDVQTKSGALISNSDDILDAWMWHFAVRPTDTRTNKTDTDTEWERENKLLVGWWDLLTRRITLGQDGTWYWEKGARRDRSRVCRLERGPRHVQYCYPQLHGQQRRGSKQVSPVFRLHGEDVSYQVVFLSVVLPDFGHVRQLYDPLWRAPIPRREFLQQLHRNYIIQNDVIITSQSLCVYIYTSLFSK